MLQKFTGVIAPLMGSPHQELPLLLGDVVVTQLMSTQPGTDQATSGRAAARASRARPCSSGVHNSYEAAGPTSGVMREALGPSTSSSVRRHHT